MIVIIFFKIIKKGIDFFKLLVRAGSLILLLTCILIIAVPQTIRENLLYPRKKKK